MKIAVNTRFLLEGRLEGIGKFTYEILRRLTARHPEAEFYFFFDRPYHPDFVFGPNVKPVVLGPPARHPFLFYLWFEVSVARALKKIKPDVFFSTDGLNTLHTKVPRVTVMHDLAFEHYPKDIKFVARKYLQYYTPRIARASERIIAVSEFTRQDLARTYHLSPTKIDVVYNDASDFFKPNTEEESAKTRRQFCQGQPFFMFVGALHPRKNLVNLLKAFDQFKTLRKSPEKLLIVGRMAWKAKAIAEVYRHLNFRNDVIFTGRISDQELSSLYGAALATVYVPIFEGFGIPIVEAQKCGCPVITSNVSSMPEVAGQGALLVDPFKPEEIAAAMGQLADSMELRAELVHLGHRNLERFSWEQSAEKVWRSLVKAVSERKK